MFSPESYPDLFLTMGVSRLCKRSSVIKQALIGRSVSLLILICY